VVSALVAVVTRFTEVVEFVAAMPDLTDLNSKTIPLAYNAEISADIG
jgi:hypothetical protein